jgi:pimeloyl-ACP methyl ester carboxylesterase
VVKNGMTIKNFLNLRIDKDNLTSLTDGEGRSFPVIGFDLRTGSGQPFGGGGNWDYTEELLPGARADVVAIFAVPDDYKPEGMVFTLAYPPKAFAQVKRTTLRIALP